MVGTEVTLEALHKQVQQRLGSVLFDQPSIHYEPLRARYQACVGNVRPFGPASARRFAGGLGGVAGGAGRCPEAYAWQQSTSARCIGPDNGRAAVEALAQQNALRPRVSPGELIQNFAARGIMIRDVDGALHVQPADRLTEADRAVLLENKPGILVALARPGAIL